MMRIEDKINLEQHNQDIINNMNDSSQQKKQQNNLLYKKRCCDSCINCCCSCFKSVDMLHQREIIINSTSKGSNYTRFKNIIKAQKYNILTFIPLVLYNQFKFFNNQFYFLMAASQFIDELKVGFLFSYIFPLVFVLVVTLLREAIDDFKRYRRDKELNTQKYIKVTVKGTKEILSSDIKIGDLIEINKNKRIPADMLILKSYDQSIFIKTDQLDGETDWKLRKPVHYFQQLGSISEAFQLNTSFTIAPPNRQIYEFNGVLNINGGINNNNNDKSNNNNDTNLNNNGNNIINGNDNGKGNALSNTQPAKIPLGLENTVWMNAVLASNKIIGCVIYTGKETRAEMNSSKPRDKVGILDIEVNTFTKILFGLMVILSALITILKGLTLQLKIDLIIFSRFVVLLCSIIPISLKINLDLSKAFFSQRISSDDKIEGAIARNSTIPEELGRVEYLFTDKTGTLTKNEMKFKRIATEIGIFQEDNSGDLKLILEDECSNYRYPMADLISLKSKQGNNYNESKRIRRNRNKIIRDSFTAMTLCNNVTPIFNSNDNQYEYQASSPDEIALVQFSEKLNMRLTFRDDKLITLLDSSGYEEQYEILATFPFSSETKRMGIVLVNKDTNQKIFYLKGAESVIESLVKEDFVSYITENTETLASAGLRTLVITQKLLDDETYENWNRVYQDALVSMDKRKEKIEFAMKLLENNMEFLCVTGVEDQLQDEVVDTIESMKNAGIKIWMLTGDKVETATCIAISTGLKSKGQRIFYIRDENNPQVLNDELDKLKYQTEFILIIDGSCIDICLKLLEKLFFEVTLNANAVVCCRCSPTQKARIISLIKKHTDKRCCAIGDGGNDVSMIQEAHVGIGLVGKEGKQASLSADFSINQFKDLKLLLLWFGRISYKNTATISHFVIHRGLIISLLQFIFSLMFYCVPIALYNGNLIVGYTSIYTSLPVISLIYDEDTDISNIIKFPALYKDLQKGRELSTKNFLSWFWKSLFQSALIMICAIFVFDNIFIKIVTVTFTCLIFAELLNVYLEIKKFHWVMLVSLSLTFILYIISLMFLKSILDLYYLSGMTILKIALITLLSWFPFFIVKRIKKMCYPSTHEKLNLLKSEN